MFAIFILANGKWAQHGPVLSASAADQSFAKGELAYLNNSLGVVARLFKKEA